jgi:predicted O-methyltransferase YrrM
VPPVTGKFLALMAASAPQGRLVEIGASAGYSAMWLALACRTRGDKLTTFEILPEKARLARETIAAAGIADAVELVEGDALALLPEVGGIAFCFLDAEKVDYQAFFDRVVPRMVPGGLLLADNVISHQETLDVFVKHALADKRLDGVVVPIGKGVLLCRRT